LQFRSSSKADENSPVIERAVKNSWLVMEKQIEKKSAEPSQAERPRRLFSFSLRTMLIFFAVVAALLHFWIIPSERQRREYHKILSEGGSCGFAGMDLENDSSATVSVAIFAFYPSPKKVEWYHHYIYPIDSVAFLQPHEFNSEFSVRKIKKVSLNGDWDVNSLLENEFFVSSVIELGIWSNNINHETIQTLSRYKKLETLVIYNKILECTDDELLMFGRFPKLKRLNINRFFSGSGRRPRWSEKVVQEKMKRKQMLIEALKKSISDVRIEYSDVQFRD
jgi:hypothetical protein